MNYWVIFLTGLTTGGLTCLAVQGALLTSLIISHESLDVKEGLRHKHKSTLVAFFLLSKLVSYTILGFLLGIFGSVFQLSSSVSAGMQVFVGSFMIVTALRILDVHPFFRRFSFEMPRFMFKYIKSASKDTSFVAPLILGFLTVFLPCGTTQAMEILAIGSGNAVTGALIMFTFILGTIPVFFFLGYFATKLSDSLHNKFMKTAALLVFVLGLFAVKNGLVLTGFNLSEYLGSISFSTNDSFLSNNAYYATLDKDGVQRASISALDYGYLPREVYVKKGVPVRLTFTTNENYSCSRAVVFPKLKLRKILPVTGEGVVEFTPAEVGVINFSCSMGMYTGRIVVE